MKVGKKDILSIKAGTSMKFIMDSYESLKSAHAYAYQLSYSKDKPKDVEKYRCSYVLNELSLTIEAVKKRKL